MADLVRERNLGPCVYFVRSVIFGEEQTNRCTSGLLLACLVVVCEGVGAYWNWFKHDPLFFIRLLFHSGHPLSPLSSLALVKGAFFSPSVPERTVEEYRWTCMRGYESLVWPNQMMRRLVDPKRVLSNLVRRENGGQKVLIVAGKRDKLMGTRLMQEMAAEYREAYRELVGEKKLEGSEHEARPKGKGTADQGVKYVELDAAHHMQNDIRWEEGAERLAEFWAQL
ncbi:Mitochondrial substrate/solute carrier [Macrophomina phaseolina MS6]|uniref:Mitochondrial substrate/solute carrier n=1 Tax=Macrophomina phaseolina (strain MS6) TaxID=1126212 RepID=K2S1Z4_MACPH|nr:Mitochondrial substrate/solute carrier [Macrophomina phaseolina MS6]